MTATLQAVSEELARLAPADPFPVPQTQEPPVPSGAGDEPGPLPAPPAPDPAVQFVDFAAKGCHLDARVPPAQVVAAASLLDARGFALDTITGVDWIAESQMEVVYDYFHPLTGERVAVRARIPRGEPVIPTICKVFPAANWHERETHDFFGIRFDGHPDLTPLLLPEDADFHPLRKDYQA
jgi:NADH-quinone oxidoreductase subunit C